MADDELRKSAALFYELTRKMNECDREIVKINNAKENFKRELESTEKQLKNT